jgi:flagellar protein FliJ
MPKFRFRLESVLKIRKSREDECLRALGAAQHAYQATLARKAALLADLGAALDRRERLGRTPVGIDAFKLEQSFIEGTKQRVAQNEQAIFRASKQVEKALRAYLTARRQTKMLETLKEKDRLEFRKEQSRIERVRQDDLTIMRHRLKDKEEVA